MKIQDSFESPQYTFSQDFGLDDDSFNIKEAHRILTNEKKQAVEAFANGTYTLYELPRAYALIDHRTDDPKIVYMMKYEINFHKFIGKQCAQQILVWRNTKDPHTINLAKNIFFNHLLQNWGTVITDSMQTPDGQRFWDNRIVEALQQKFYVYYINLIPKREIVQIKNYTEYQGLANKKEIWGNDAKHQARRIIITTNALSQI